MNQYYETPNQEVVVYNVPSSMAKIRSVIEAHPIEYGWVAGEPEIYKDNEGKYGVKIPLVKYSQEQNLGRSR